MESPNYEDEMYAFFESCHHLKDWLKNDPAEPVAEGSDVEAFVGGSEPLRWCADIANGSKHLAATIRPRVDPNVGVGRRDYAVALGGPTMISARYSIVGAGKSRDAMELADDCLAEWKQFLEHRGLIS